MLSATSRNFLDKHVETVEDLEILLLLRAAPMRDWDAVDVGREIGLEPIAASNRLMRLYLNGLLDHPQKGGRLFHFRHCVNSSSDRCLSELAAIFEKSRMEVVHHILNRQRTQLLHFADAFRIDREPKDG